MSELEDRLVRCFASVFPTFTPEEICAAHAGATEEWDSLTAITLIAVVQQEFGVDIDPLNLAELTSFAAFRAYLSPYFDADSVKSIHK